MRPEGPEDAEDTSAPPIVHSCLLWELSRGGIPLSSARAGAAAGLHCKERPQSPQLCSESGAQEQPRGFSHLPVAGSRGETPLAKTATPLLEAWKGSDQFLSPPERYLIMFQVELDSVARKGHVKTAEVLQGALPQAQPTKPQGSH